MIGSYGEIERYAEERYEAGRHDVLVQIKAEIKELATFENVDVLADVMKIIDKYTK